jgi:hypothetical protein
MFSLYICITPCEVETRFNLLPVHLVDIAGPGVFRSKSCQNVKTTLHAACFPLKGDHLNKT